MFQGQSKSEFQQGSSYSFKCVYNTMEALKHKGNRFDAWPYNRSSVTTTSSVRQNVSQNMSLSMKWPAYQQRVDESIVGGGRAS